MSTPESYDSETRPTAARIAADVIPLPAADPPPSAVVDAVADENRAFGDLDPQELSAELDEPFILEETAQEIPEAWLKEAAVFEGNVFGQRDSSLQVSQQRGEEGNPGEPIPEQKLLPEKREAASVRDGRGKRPSLKINIGAPLTSLQPRPASPSQTLAKMPKIEMRPPSGALDLDSIFERRVEDERPFVLDTRLEETTYSCGLWSTKLHACQNEISLIGK